MQVAYVGCGYAADLYMRTDARYQSFQVVAAYDRDLGRLDRFAARHGVRAASCLEELLLDPSIAIIVNLTNPSQHSTVTLQAIRDGKHVYSEKPLALDTASALLIKREATAAGVTVSCAPATPLGPALRKLAHLVGDGIVGSPELARVRMHDGALEWLRPELWRSESGAPWPVEDELRIGCVFEHGAYALAPLVLLFGPIRELMAWSATLGVRKARFGLRREELGPDAAWAVLRFTSNVVAHLEVSTAIPQDRTLEVVGSDGVVTLCDLWDSKSEIHVHRASFPDRPFDHSYLTNDGVVSWPRNEPASDVHNIDWSSGIADLVAALEEKRRTSLPLDVAVHLVDALEAISIGGEHRLRTRNLPQLEAI